LAAATASAAAEVKILLPLGRTAYQTNEWIDISVVRSSPQALEKSELKLSLTGKDGSIVSTTFAVPAVPVKDREARATEHLHVNANCVMSGANQMDLRMECDWSDPSVTRGGTMRVVRRAMIDRTRPNVPGVHFYDEPGLTWHKHPRTGEFTPHEIPAQVRSYVAAFGHEPIPYDKIDPKNPEHVRRWNHWARWKLGLM